MNILESSGDYVEMTYKEAQLWEQWENDNNQHAWQDPDMQRRQYETVVCHELEAFARDEPIAPYDAFIRLVRGHPLPPGAELLDVGASCGYYSQVLDISDIPYLYTGLDYSHHYAELAEKLFGVQ